MGGEYGRGQPPSCPCWKTKWQQPPLCSFCRDEARQEKEGGEQKKNQSWCWRGTGIFHRNQVHTFSFYAEDGYPCHSTHLFNDHTLKSPDTLTQAPLNRSSSSDACFPDHEEEGLHALTESRDEEGHCSHHVTRVWISAPQVTLSSDPRREHRLRKSSWCLQ